MENNGIEEIEYEPGIEAGMPIEKYREKHKDNPKITDMLNQLMEESRVAKLQKEKPKRKEFKFPKPWLKVSKRAQNNPDKRKDKVAVLYLTNKGNIEVMLVDIYRGSMLIIKDRIHSFDPRAIWNVKVGFKIYKFIIIKQIDSRPISNMDLENIRERGDSTEHDEYLQKIALSMALAPEKKKMNLSKGTMIVIAVIVIGALLAFFFLKGG